MSYTLSRFRQRVYNVLRRAFTIDYVYVPEVREYRILLKKQWELQTKKSWAVLHRVRRSFACSQYQRFSL
jgi:hypothetical protein